MKLHRPIRPGLIGAAKVGFLRSTAVPHTLVSQTTIGGAPGGITSGAIDTSTATLLVAVVSHYPPGSTPTVSDSKSNSWTGLTDRAAGDSGTRIFYCLAPTVGSGHTITVGGGTPFAALKVYAFKGPTTFGGESGSTATASSIQPGSLTPDHTNSVLVTGVADKSSSASIDSGFTADSIDYSAGNYIGLGAAYLIETTPAAKNPTWTLAGSGDLAAAMAWWK